MKVSDKMFSAPPSRLQKSALAVAIIVVSTILLHTFLYWRAVNYLQTVNMQDRSELSQPVFYAAPKHFSVGQELNLPEVVAVLRQIGYTETSGKDDEGTFRSLGKNELRINSRLKEFNSVVITFDKGKISCLRDLIRNEDVPEMLFESETLATFVLSIRDDRIDRFAARRRILQSHEVWDTPLFFAILAAEDHQFLRHRGVRPEHVLKGFFGGRGGSTLSMQVTRNAISLDARVAKMNIFQRKIFEIYLTLALEKRFDKQQIFEMYVNHTFLGKVDGGVALYGYLAALEEYFALSKEDLKTRSPEVIAACAALAGITHSPQRYLNRVQDEAKTDEEKYSSVVERRDWVLDKMRQNFPEQFSDAEIEAAKKVPARFVFRSKQIEAKPYEQYLTSSLQFVRAQPDWIPVERLPLEQMSGTHTHTTFDLELHKTAYAALAKTIPNLENANPPVDSETKRAAEDALLGAIVAINPQSREVLVMQGFGQGYPNDGAAAEKNGKPDGKRFKVDKSWQALNARFPFASTKKPLDQILAVADASMPNGEPFTAATIIKPSEGRVGDWRPTTGVGSTPMTARRCLSASDDGCAAFVYSLVGAKKSSDFVASLTHREIREPNALNAIGFSAGMEVSPLELAKIYSIFATNGRYPDEVSALRSVLVNNQKFELKPPPEMRVVADPSASYVIAQELRSVIGDGADGAVGTARKLNFSRRFLREFPDSELSAKTGSGPGSTVFVSVSPQLVVVVMLGYENGSSFRNARQVLARDTAGLIWSQFMLSVAKHRPDLLRGKLSRPEGIVSQRIDSLKGCLSPAGQMPEVFMSDKLPAVCK